MSSQLSKPGTTDVSMKCPTRACSSAVHRTHDWQQGDHCEYVEAECPQCSAKYWLIKRNDKYHLKYRKDGESFDDHRKDNRT